jgi:hypothetical protein
MIIRLVVDFGGLVNMVLKRGGSGKRCDGWGKKVWELLGFLVPVRVWVYFCCTGGSLCQGLQGTGFVYSWYSRLLSECECGERSSGVTGWGKERRKRLRWWKEWMRRAQKSSWEGEQWIVAQEKEKK